MPCIPYVKNVEVFLAHRLLLFPVNHHSHNFFFTFIMFLMLQVSFKLVTWYIEIHHLTIFLFGVMTFLYIYMMFIHNVFIFKGKAYCAFWLL